MSGDLTIVDEIRACCATLAVMFEERMLDKASLAEGLGAITGLCAQLDGKPEVAATVNLPLLTMADVAAEAGRPRLQLVLGGLL